MVKPEPRSCRKATELLSRSLDQPLGLGERFWLRWHLGLCSSCRNFRQQLGHLRTFSHHLPDQDRQPPES
ncbi:zf-HC2 domain-containing protein [Leeia sp.]|uniref:zf-HC2 domain-containing protein n=1 Tax=Leeia sp. TaxID=2884678 RepID=UPI0035B37EF0